MVSLKTRLGLHCSCPLGPLCPSRHVLGHDGFPLLIRYNGLHLYLLEIGCFWSLYLLLSGCDAHTSLAGHLDPMACSTGGEGLSSFRPGQAWPPRLPEPVAGDIPWHVRRDHGCVLRDPCD